MRTLEKEALPNDLRQMRTKKQKKCCQQGSAVTAQATNMVNCYYPVLRNLTDTKWGETGTEERTCRESTSPNVGLGGIEGLSLDPNEQRDEHW